MMVDDANADAEDVLHSTDILLVGIASSMFNS